MSGPGFGLSGTPQPSIANALEQKLRAERVVKAGANWFITVAVLSMINSVLSMSGAGIRNGPFLSAWHGTLLMDW